VTIIVILLSMVISYFAGRWSCPKCETRRLNGALSNRLATLRESPRCHSCGTYHEPCDGGCSLVKAGQRGVWGNA
jgi:hypothetical protein